MKLNFRKFSDSGPALLILHGLFGNLRNWNRIAQELATDFQVIALDLRNHGESPHADSMSYAEMAADVLEFLDDQSIQAGNFLGHSMGGKVAMRFALDYPQRTSRLLVVDIAPIRYEESRGGHDDVFAGMFAVDLASISSRADAEEQMAPHIPEVAVRQFLASNLVKDGTGGYRWRFNLAALHSNYSNLREAIASDSGFAGKVAFLKGAESNYIREEDRSFINRLFPKANLIEIDGAGHWLHAEQPKRVIDLSREFFSRGESP